MYPTGFSPRNVRRKIAKRVAENISFLDKTHESLPTYNPNHAQCTLGKSYGLANISELSSSSSDTSNDSDF